MVNRTNKSFKAGSIHTHPERLKKLSRDVDRKVRRRVAANASCRQSTLTRLADDRSKEVRRQVALNPESSYTTLTKLSFDSSPDVRFALAESARTPIALLRRMSHDDLNPYVKARAKETIDHIEEQLKMENGNRNIVCHMEDHLKNQPNLLK